MRLETDIPTRGILTMNSGVGRQYNWATLWKWAEQSGASLTYCGSQLPRAHDRSEEAQRRIGPAPSRGVHKAVRPLRRVPQPSPAAQAAEPTPPAAEHAPSSSVSSSAAAGQQPPSAAAPTPLQAERQRQQNPALLGRRARGARASMLRKLERAGALAGGALRGGWASARPQSVWPAAARQGLAATMRTQHSSGLDAPRGESADSVEDVLYVPEVALLGGGDPLPQLGPEPTVPPAVPASDSTLLGLEDPPHRVCGGSTHRDNGTRSRSPTHSAPRRQPLCPPLARRGHGRRSQEVPEVQGSLPPSVGCRAAINAPVPPAALGPWELADASSERGLLPSTSPAAVSLPTESVGPTGESGESDGEEGRERFSWLPDVGYCAPAPAAAAEPEAKSPSTARGRALLHSARRYDMNGRKVDAASSTSPASQAALPRIVSPRPQESPHGDGTVGVCAWSDGQHD